MITHKETPDHPQKPNSPQNRCKKGRIRMDFNFKKTAEFFNPQKSSSVKFRMNHTIKNVFLPQKLQVSQNKTRMRRQRLHKGNLNSKRKLKMDGVVEVQKNCEQQKEKKENEELNFTLGIQMQKTNRKKGRQIYSHKKGKQMKMKKSSGRNFFKQSVQKGVEQMEGFRLTNQFFKIEQKIEQHPDSSQKQQPHRSQPKQIDFTISQKYLKQKMKQIKKSTSKKKDTSLKLNTKYKRKQNIRNKIHSNKAIRNIIGVQNQKSIKNKENFINKLNNFNPQSFYDIFQRKSPPKLFTSYNNSPLNNCLKRRNSSQQSQRLHSNMILPNVISQRIFSQQYERQTKSKRGRKYQISPQNILRNHIHFCFPQIYPQSSRVQQRPNKNGFCFQKEEGIGTQLITNNPNQQLLKRRRLSQLALCKQNQESNSNQINPYQIQRQNIGDKVDKYKNGSEKLMKRQKRIFDKLFDLKK